jgi:hypothetical protein
MEKEAFQKSQLKQSQGTLPAITSEPNYNDKKPF